MQHVSTGAIHFQMMVIEHKEKAISIFATSKMTLQSLINMQLSLLHVVVLTYSKTIHHEYSWIHIYLVKIQLM